MQNSKIDISKIVLEAFKNEFPGAPESEVSELIQEMGQTIVIESMAKTLDAIQEADKSINKDLHYEVKDLIENKTDPYAIFRIAEICENLGIDLEKIYRDVATDVVKDVLGK